MTEYHSVEALIRPGRDRKPYRLKCRFVTPAFPNPDFVQKARVKMAERFIEDMYKQGWVNVERFGFRMTGPYPATQTVVLPKPTTDPFHIPSRDLLPALQNGYVPRVDRSAVDGGSALEVPPITESENWEFELSGVFHREEILTEHADPHEEVDGRKNR